MKGCFAFTGYGLFGTRNLRRHRAHALHEQLGRRRLGFRPQPDHADGADQQREVEREHGDHLLRRQAQRQRFGQRGNGIAGREIFADDRHRQRLDDIDRRRHAVAPASIHQRIVQQRLDRQGPLDVKDVLRIGLQAASGLAAAHAQGLVHRDVKPANILLETSVERVMLTDFGLARAVDDATLTRTGIIAGTPQYMSPEQANGDAVDPRSDLFSLGSVLYAMCTARPPFRADSTFGVLRRIRETSPRPIREINADIPEWLERIVMKLLSKSPDDRIASATQTATLLEQCLAHVQQPTTVPLPADVPTQQGIQSSRSPNRKWHLAQIAAVALLIGGITTWAIWSQAKPAIDDGQKILVDRSLADDSLIEWDTMQMKLDTTANDIESLNTEARQEFEGLDEAGFKREGGD